MGKTKYKTREIPCKDCGTPTPGYSYTDPKTKRTSRKDYCDKCAGIRMTKWVNENPFPWEDAFDKYGFNDGDGEVYTELVVEFLQDHGYTVDFATIGLYNTIITKLTDKDGQVVLDAYKDNLARHLIGMENPRGYLPKKLIELLDSRFGGGENA